MLLEKISKRVKVAAALTIKQNKTAPFRGIFQELGKRRIITLNILEYI